MPDVPFDPDDWTPERVKEKMDALIAGGKSYEEAWASMYAAANAAGQATDAQSHQTDTHGTADTSDDTPAQQVTRVQAHDPNDPEHDSSPDPQDFKEQYRRQVQEHP